MDEIMLTVTDITTDQVVSCELVSREQASQVIGHNLHIARLREYGNTIIVETTGRAFRYFFDFFPY